MIQEISSAKTCLKQIAGGFTTMEKHKLHKRGNRNMDLGGGTYDLATEHLKQLGVRNLVLDPFNRPFEETDRILEELFLESADTGTCFNVLNVISEPHARLLVLETLHTMVKPEGLIYIDVHPGDRSGVGRITKKDCWQENRVLDTYVPEILSVFPDMLKAHGLLVVQNFRG